MTYEQFKAEYTNLFKSMMSYTPNQVGAQTFAEKMADLSDKYPEFAAQAEGEENE